MGSFSGLLLPLSVSGRGLGGGVFLWTLPPLSPKGERGGRSPHRRNCLAWCGVSPMAAARRRGPPMRIGTRSPDSGTSRATANCRSRSLGQPLPWCWITSSAVTQSRHGEDLKRQLVLGGELSIGKWHPQQIKGAGPEFIVAQHTDQPQFGLAGTAQCLDPDLPFPQVFHDLLGNSAHPVLAINHIVVQFHSRYVPVTGNGAGTAQRANRPRVCDGSLSIDRGHANGERWHGTQSASVLLERFPADSNLPIPKSGTAGARGPIPDKSPRFPFLASFPRWNDGYSLACFPSEVRPESSG